MLEFIQRLIQKYHDVLVGLNDAATQKPALLKNLDSLKLAGAALNKTQLIEKRPNLALQVAVIGPTQAGKSSVVNLLLDESLAGVSALAGFTVHPQGFTVNTDPAQLTWLDGYFSGYTHSTPDSLSHDRYDSYVLMPSSTVHKTLPPSVVWDTPDFDSIDAAGYSDAVLRTAALADVVLLVVSKDKYADHSVWEIMKLLEPLAQQTLICLNKTNQETQATVASSLEQKWRATRTDKLYPIVALPYTNEQQLKDYTVPLQQALLAANNRVKRNSAHRSTHDFLRMHWKAWTAPLLEEHKTVEGWTVLLDQAIDDAVSLYERDYLNHSQHYETFQRALAELLKLLEVPGLASPLHYARKAITWPVRQLVKLGKSSASKGKGQSEGDSQELSILNQVFDHFIIRLSNDVLDKASEDPDHTEWWQMLGTKLREQKQTFSTQFNSAALHYHEDFQEEIESSAQQLYTSLEEHPVTLNSLRATRVSTDAAALAVAFHTGGIGLHDFILAPAVLSMTSMLVEGALGGHMKKVERQLKKRQYGAVKQQLFIEGIRSQLNELPLQLDQKNRFNISTEMLEKAQQALETPKNGLRIF